MKHKVIPESDIGGTSQVPRSKARGHRALQDPCRWNDRKNPWRSKVFLLCTADVYERDGVGRKIDSQAQTGRRLRTGRPDVILLEGGRHLDVLLRHHPGDGTDDGR